MESCTHRSRTAAKQLNMAWCYWDFAIDFDAYDLATDTWRQPRRAALLDN
jgi:hypothetical protein